MTKNSGALAVGARVTMRTGSGHAAPERGAIVADYGQAVALVADDLGRDWAPVRRWAVALDDAGSSSPTTAISNPTQRRRPPHLVVGPAPPECRVDGATPCVRGVGVARSIVEIVTST